jgi:outer membrane protein OmpA-like peptidoglycan-associated protein
VLHGADFAADTRAIESSDEIVAAVAKDRDAIAYVTVGRVTSAVRVVAIAAPGKAPVAPTPTTIRDGSYPIYRPLLLYVRGQPGATEAALVRFCLSPAGQQLVRESGFVPSDVPEDVVAGTGAAAPRLALRVTFRAASATIDRDAKGSLWTLANELRETEDRVVLIGNADGVGASKGNARLAQRRAAAVADYLRRNGIAPTRITVDSSGADAPVASNATRAGRDANRRVDVIVVR